MTAETYNQFARDDRAAELRAIHAENVLMRYYLGSRAPERGGVADKPASTEQQIKQALQHGPRSACDLKKLIGKRASSGLTYLKRVNAVRQKSHGVWELNPGSSVKAVLLLFVLLCSVVSASAQNVALLPPPLPAGPSGETFNLAWDASPSRVQSYRVYSTTNKTSPVWRLVATTTNTVATVSNVFMPTWWVARAFDGTESTNSNIIGWVTNYQVLTVTGQSSSNLTTWQPLGTLTTRTNPQGVTFFRTAAKLSTYKQIEQ